MAQPQAPLLPFEPGSIPQALRAQPRWAPWKAVWSEKRGKFDKIPCATVAPFYGISTARPERWGDFDQAVAAAQAYPGVFAGVGYVMTGPHGVVGIDLDHCVGAEGVAPWAAEVVGELGGYAERSPSGTGVRVFVAGAVPLDWTNHEVGIEVYGGNEPRFLTVSGQRLPGSAGDLVQARPTVLEGLRARYARDVTPSSAQVISMQLPDLLDELALPDPAELDLPWQVREFLVDGVHRGDRSRELFAAAVALYGAGLASEQVFSVLASNPHALEIALDHRRQDHDRALMYLWVEHAQKAKGRATSKVATVDDFDDVSERAPVKRPRFSFTPGEEFFDPAHPPTRWLIKHLLPEASLCMLFGPSTAGKTFFALDLSMSVALGRPWRDRKVSPGAVAYICAEGGTGFRRRGRAYLEYHGIERADLPMHLLADAPNLLEKGDVKDLTEALKRIPGLRLVVVDTLAQTTPGANENASEDMGRAMTHCARIIAATGATVLLVGHTGKDEDRGHRGWSGMPAAFDMSIQLEREGDYRAATVTKLKDGQGEGDEFPFHLRSVILGQDEDGEDITSCVALPGNAGGAPRLGGRKPKGNVERLVLRVATELTDLPGEVTTTQLVDAAANEMPAAEQGKRDRRREVVLRAIESLVASNALSVAGGVVNLQNAAG